jgi:hypothetical protein
MELKLALIARLHSKERPPLTCPCKNREKIPFSNRSELNQNIA